MKSGKLAQKDVDYSRKRIASELRFYRAFQKDSPDLHLPPLRLKGRDEVRRERYEPLEEEGLVSVYDAEGYKILATARGSEGEGIFRSRNQPEWEVQAEVCTSHQSRWQPAEYDDISLGKASTLSGAMLIVAKANLKINFDSSLEAFAYARQLERDRRMEASGDISRAIRDTGPECREEEDSIEVEEGGISV